MGEAFLFNQLSANCSEGLETVETGGQCGRGCSDLCATPPTMPGWRHSPPPLPCSVHVISHLINCSCRRCFMLLSLLLQLQPKVFRYNFNSICSADPSARLICLLPGLTPHAPPQLANRPRILRASHAKQLTGCVSVCVSVHPQASMCAYVSVCKLIKNV